MSWYIPARTTTWESVATLQLANSTGTKVISDDPEIAALIQLSGLQAIPPAAGAAPLYFEAYRAIDEETVDSSYHQVLARVSGQKCVPSLLQIDVASEDKGHIVICPYGPKKELAIPLSVWRAVVRHLRSYGRRVYLMADKGERMDGIAFTEAEILSERSMKEKLEVLATATLTVGVPGAWMWLATSWQKQLIVLYPEGIPPRKWFPFVHENFGRLLYPADRLQIPVFLAGLRMLISRF